MGMFISGSSTSTGSFHELHIADRVGIGTSAPNRSLTIVSSESAAINLDSSNNSFIHIDRGAINDVSEIAFRTGGSNIFSMGLGNSNNIGDGTDFFIGTASGGSGDVRFLIDSSGNVGIGTTSPSQKLEVVGAALINNGSSNHNLYFGNTSYGIHVVHSSGVMNFVSNDSTRFQIKNGGDVNVMGWVEGNGQNALYSAAGNGLLLQAPATTEKIYFRDLF